MTFRFRITPFLDFIAYVRSMDKMNNAGRLTQRNSAQTECNSSRGTTEYKLPRFSLNNRNVKLL